MAHIITSPWNAIHHSLQNVMLVFIMVPFTVLCIKTRLPVEGVDAILGNDLAGGYVFPRPVEIGELNASDCSRLVPCFAPVFSACPVTYAQTRKFRDVVDLSETVLDKFCFLLFLYCPLL